MTQDAPSDRARRAWIGPLLSTLLSTLLTLPTAFFALVGAALSPMSCDSCTQAQAARFSPIFDTAFTVFLYGLVIPAVLLLAAWSLPRRRRHAAPRTLLATLAPLSVLALYPPFTRLVDWP
ncbi:hypothetical protein [Streptomyces sp. NPDC002855]|uniref:hypothetical protein n=1 Tax=Streptomyces sp. NPDC002855 TaxID=3154437 RepID=UPI0033278A11